MKLKRKLLVFAPFFSAEIIILILGLFNSADAKAWWSLVLVVSILLSFLMAFVFNSIANFQKIPENHLLRWGIFISVINLVFGVLYYLLPNDQLFARGGYQDINLIYKLVFSESLYWVRQLSYPILFFVYGYFLKDK